MNRFVFAKTGWCREYRDLDSDPPVGQHEWLQAHSGHEAFNFKPHDGRVYGYFPVGSESEGPNLRRIDPSGSGGQLDGVTVVWTATDPEKGGTKVVGWYRNATVFDRAMHDGPWAHPNFSASPGGRCIYICMASAADARLVPVTDRDEWAIPPREIPQANIRYPTREDYTDLDAPWALRILERIEKFVNGLPEERKRRDEVWAEIQRRGADAVSPSVIRDLEAYSGASGTWADVDRTRDLTLDGAGVTVSVLHTGRSYPDDLTEDFLLYHYPTTNRPRGRDVSEIEATKNAARLGLPILALVPSTVPGTHRVRKGWVKSWDDASRTFLIQFGPLSQPTLGDNAEDDSSPFDPIVPRSARPRRSVAQRPDQAAFKFAVVKRYGAACAVCDLSLSEALDAAHIVPDKHWGSIDPRNGLVLCATHHRAYDAGLFDIDPDSLRVVACEGGPSLDTQRVHRTDLTHLRRQPGKAALEWRWKRRSD